jgi:hypothetical protein
LIFNKKIKDDPLDTKGIIIVLYKNNIIERLCVHTFYEQQSVNTRRHKDEIIDLTEQVLDANGLECDERISKLSEEKLREILEEVRKLRNRRKRSVNDDNSNSKKELFYVR